MRVRLRSLAVLLCVAVVPAAPARAADAPKPAKAASPKAPKAAPPSKAPAPEPAPLPPRFTWDIPEILETVDVPGLSRGVKGVPVKLQAVKSKLKLPELMDHIERSFVKAQLYIPPAKNITKLTSDPQLHALDPGRQIGFSAIFQPNADGTTTVILGEAHLAEAQPDTGYFAPVFPGAMGVIQSATEGNQMLAYSVTATEDEVRGYYRDVLSMQGYTDLGEGKFKKGSDELTISFHRNVNSGSAVVVTKGAYMEEGLVDPTKPATATPRQ